MFISYLFEGIDLELIYWVIVLLILECNNGFRFCGNSLDYSILVILSIFYMFIFLFVCIWNRKIFISNYLMIKICFLSEYMIYIFVLNMF